MSTFTGGTPLARGPMGGDGYTTIHRGVFRDPSLSAKAKGIFGYLSTHTDGWRVSEKSIAKAMRDGRDAIRAGLRELEEHHYLIRGQERGEGGTWGGSVWFFTDLPAQIGALGITDPELVAAKVAGAFDEWQKARSSPLTENPSSAVTSGNSPPTVEPAKDAQVDERLPRSEPLTGFPSTDNPRAANPPHKKRIFKEINKTDRQESAAAARTGVAEGDAACLPDAPRDDSERAPAWSSQPRKSMPDTSGARLLRRLALPVTAQVIRQHHQAVSDLLQTWPESALISLLEREAGSSGVISPMAVLVATIRDTEPFRGGSRPAGRAGALSELPPPCGQCEARPGDPACTRTVESDAGLPIPCPRCHPSVINNQEDQS